MQIEPFLLASTIEGVIAQRLIRILCPRCKEEYRPSKTELLEIHLSEEAASRMKFFKPKGCSFCRGGYKGRTGLFEVLIPTEPFWRAIIEKRPLGEIRRVAIEECGMKTLLDDGLEKINEGITSIEEVAREIHGY